MTDGHLRLASQKLRGSILLLLILCAASFLNAQTRDLSSIRGCIQDATGSYIAGATVTLTNQSTGYTRTVHSDNSGCFASSGLPLTGKYTVKVEKEGFSPVQRGGLDLQAGEAANLRFKMGVAGEKNEVTVVGTAESLSTTPELGSSMDLPEIDSTPILGRKVTNLPMLDSSVKPARGTGDAYVGNPVFIVNGNGRRQTTFIIDNASADDSWGRQTIFASIPLSAVQEFGVVTNALSAEYGKTTGAAINIVTKQGTNNWHGDLIGLWRPQAWEAAAPTATIHVADTLVQGSGSVGGPIIKDRTYFLAAGEYTYQKRDAPMNSPLVPTLKKYTGEYEQALGLLRLDQKINNANNLTVRLNFDGFSDTNPSDTVSALTLPSAGRDFKRNTYMGQISETAVFGPRTVNEARAQIQVASPIAQFTPYNFSIQYNRPGVATEGESRSSSLLNHQYYVADTLMMTRGRHHLKFGGDMLYSSTGGFGQEFGGGFVQGQFTVGTPALYKPLDQLTINDMVSYTQSFGNLNYHIGETIWGLFAQDDFNVTRDLTLNLGLRYERQTFTDGEKNFAPRVGFAYRLPGDRSTVLRGSYSIFYSELRANLGAAFAINGPEGVFSYTAVPGGVGFPTSLNYFTSFPTGQPIPPRDINVRPGQAAYLSKFFDVSKLRFYPDQFLNPYTQQWTFGLEHELSRNWLVSFDYTGQHTIHIDKPVDLNAPTSFVRTAQGQSRSASTGPNNADATRPLNPTATGFRRIVATTNLGAAYYNGLQVKVTHRLTSKLYVLASYTWSHAMNTVDWDGTGGQQEAADALLLGRADLADSMVDQRHRAVITASYNLPWRFTVGTSSTFASARPYNPVTGTDNNGDTVRNDRPVVNGQVVRRNSYRGSAFVDIGTYVEKAFKVTERAELSFRGEAYNLLNHNNLTLRNATYGNNVVPNATFGAPLGGVNNADPARQFQFLVRMRF